MTANLGLFLVFVAALGMLFIPRLMREKKVERWDSPVDPFAGTKLGTDVVALVIQNAACGAWIVLINRGTAIGLAGTEAKQGWLSQKLMVQLRRTDHKVWRILATHHPYARGIVVQRFQVPRMVLGDVLPDIQGLLSESSLEVFSVEVLSEIADGYAEDLLPDGLQVSEVSGEGVRS